MGEKNVAIMAILLLTMVYTQMARQSQVLRTIDRSLSNKDVPTYEDGIYGDDNTRRLTTTDVAYQRKESILRSSPAAPVVVTQQTPALSGQAAPLHQNEPPSQALTNSPPNSLSTFQFQSEPKPSVFSWRSMGLFDVDGAPSRRLERFPSVDERVRFYMSSWYAPPCNNTASRVRIDPLNTEGSLFGVSGVAQDDLSPDNARLLYVSNEPRSDTIFALDRKKLEECANSGRKTGLEKHYCPELLSEVLPLWGPDTRKPLLVQVGDSQKSIMGNKNEPHNIKRFSYSSIPHLAKTRPAWSPATWQNAGVFETACPKRQMNDGKFDRIIWKLKRSRHFKDLDKVLEEDAVPWEEKKSMAIFRGAASGSESLQLPSTAKGQDRCLLRPRCALVARNINSTTVDAKFVATDGPKEYPDKYYAARSTKDQLLQYKALIMLQGNDVSTGLKWAMLSSSVVLMPKPTISSWFMEELLQPYIHYVPIKEDMSDVEAKMRWINNHDEKAQRIAVRGSLWVKDMLYHQDSEKDERAIFSDILSRYRAHFES